MFCGACGKKSAEPARSFDAAQVADAAIAAIDAAVPVDALEVAIDAGPGASGTFTIWIDNREGQPTTVALGEYRAEVGLNVYMPWVVPDTVTDRDVLVGGKRVGRLEPAKPDGTDYVVDVSGRRCYVRDVARYEERPQTARRSSDLSERWRPAKLHAVWGEVDYFLQLPPSSVSTSSPYLGTSRLFIVDCPKKR
jgi:hypothetical protein